MDVRLAALKCLVKILEHKNYFDEVFNDFAQKTNSPSELKNTVAGAVRHKITLDCYIDKVSSKKLRKLSPNVRNILRLGVFELEFLQRPGYAAVNSYVDLCKKIDKPAVNFVNAVLRNFIRQRAGISPREEALGEIKFLSIKHSHPEWLVKRWIELYGRHETEKICEFNNRPSKTSLRINTLKSSKDELLKLFTENSISFEQSLFSQNCLIINNAGNIKKIPGYEEGFWAVQGESSTLVSEVLDPQPGERILDFCAAPGSKTTHIAALMEDKGEITAVDMNPERLKRVSENCKRLGVGSVKVIAQDASEFCFSGEFDRVLADVPCSNTGVLASRPDARWQKNPRDIESLTALQMKILNNAAKQLKPGGILVYSTCSIEPEENELQVNRFLSENSGFSLEDFTLSRGFAGEVFPGKLQILQPKYGIDGFFIAKLKRVT